jgi:TctA family transporter
MAILLGGFVLLGLVPGPEMLSKHLSVTYSMVWTIVIANVVTVVVCFLFLDWLARLTGVRGGILIPMILLLVFVGSFTSNNHYGDIVVTLVFGALGYFMVLAGWPRAPFVLGLVLGKIAENYLWISVARYEAAWLTRPVVLVLIVISVAVVLYPLFQARRRSAHA